MLAPADLTPEESIRYYIAHLATLLGRQSDQVLQERLGIGMSQFKIMMTLMWSPQVRQKVIARNLGQTEASISRQVKLLHQQRLLQTSRNPQNKREHITTLTAKGEAVTHQAFEILHGYHKPTLSALSTKQQKQLLELLKLLHQSAKNA